MYSEKPSMLIDVEGPTIPTAGMPFLMRVYYLIIKFTNFVWRYRKNPLYLFTYLRFISSDSYKEKVNFMSDETFLELAKRKSTLRLQDGEFTLLLGTRDIGYEKKNEKLTKMWMDAISSYTDSSPYILGLPPYIIIDNETLHKNGFKYIWMPAKILYRLLFPKKQNYFNGSYFYIDNKSIPFMQTLSKGNDVLLVSNKDVIEATKIHETIFFKEAHIVAYIETPERNAFASYDSIMENIESQVTPLTVIFMACGPAGKVTIHDLSKKGIRAHDIGYGLTGAYTGESREHFLKWNIFGPLYYEILKQKK